MKDDITVKYYRKRLKDFHVTIEDFCQEEGIPCTINNALHYKANMGVGRFWKHLYVAPKLYLANSRAFLNYRNTLDPDFKNEIIDTEEIFSFQQEALKNLYLQKELQKIMKNDFINYKY